MSFIKEYKYPVFVDFIRTTEEKMNVYPSLAGSYALVTCKGKFLICYNVWRNQWEIPAGHREKNETPKECAIRELFEETGQKVVDMFFLGILKSIRTNGEIKLNPVFFTEVNALQTFIKNEEISAIKLWDLKEKLSPSIDPIDIKIFDYILKTDSFEGK